MSRELSQLNVDAIPGATLRTGMLTVPPESVAQANAEPERIGPPVLFSPDRDDPDLAQREHAHGAPRHKDTEQRLKAPNGNPTNPTERHRGPIGTPAVQRWSGGGGHMPPQPQLLQKDLMLHRYCRHSWRR